MQSRPAPNPLLLGALIVFAAVVALTGGGIALQPGGRFDVAVAALALACAVSIAAGATRPAPMRLQWAGALLLAAFAAWCALSVAWSALPDASWVGANRALAYTLIVAVALAVASNARNAATLTALGILGTGALIALLALGGKLAPGVHIGSVSLDPGGRFSRLSRPLDYWNALALICVMAAPPAIWLAAARVAAARVRVAATLILALLLLTATLAYSRGAVIAFAVVLAIMVGAGPRRLTRLAVTAGALVAVAPAMLVAFSRHDLSASGVPLSDRITGGLVLAGVLALCLGGLGLATYELVRLERRASWGPDRARTTWICLAGCAAVALCIGVALLATSQRGLGGETSHQIDNFKNPGSSLSNNPERLISANSSNRYVWWEEALGAFSDRPLAGWGAGSFPVIQALYRHQEAPVRSSHSLPLALLSETGLVGFALCMGALALLAAAAIGRVRSARGVERSARLALLAAFAAWFVESLYDWHWEIPGVTAPALIALAVAAAVPVRRAARDRPRDGWRFRLAVAGAALAALAVAALAYLPVLSEQKRLDALAEAGGRPRNLAAAADDASLAHRLDPFAVEPLFTAASIAQARGQTRQAFELLADATATQPDNSKTWAELAQRTTNPHDAAMAAEEQARTDPLSFADIGPVVSSASFSRLHPSAASPTAFGTPPP